MNCSVGKLVSSFGTLFEYLDKPVNCLFVVLCLHCAFERVHDEYGVRHATLHPNLAVEPDVQLELEVLAELTKKVGVLSKEITAERDGEISDEAFIQLSEERLARIPRLLIHRRNATKLAFGEFIVAEHTAVNEITFLVIGFVSSSRSLEFK